MLAHYTMEPGETIMKTAWWNEAAALWWELHCVESPSIFCPLSAMPVPGNSTLCTAPGYLQANSRPSVLRRATDIRLSVASRCALHAAPSLVPSDTGGALGPPETGFPRVVLCSLVWCGHRPGGSGVKYSERRKYLDEIDNRVSGVTVSRRIVTQLASSQSKVLIRGKDNEGYFGIRSHFRKP